MTVVLAVKDENGKPWIASDSYAYYYETYVDAGKKLVDFGNYIVGYSSGSYLIKSILENCKEFPDSIDDHKDVNSFCIELKNELRKREVSLKNEDDYYPMYKDTALLLINNKNIYEVCSDFSYIDVKISAIGIGRTFALGAYEVSKQLSLSIERRLIASLEATYKHCHLCGGDIHINTIDK